MKIWEIDPYSLFTIEECDNAIAFVVQECADIEEQLEFPSEEATIGWIRRAKTSLQIGKGLKQRLQNRRGDITAEIRQVRARRHDAIVANLCKEMLPKEQFQSICKLADERLATLTHSSDGISNG